MSHHNIIQIETNIKIVEEKQNHPIKKSNLSYRDLNFFNEDISWASIDADLLNTSWGMLLTDAKPDEMNEGKVFYGQEPPSGESTTTECGFNYQLLAVIYWSSPMGSS